MPICFLPATAASYKIIAAWAREILSHGPSRAVRGPPAAASAMLSRKRKRQVHGSHRRQWLPTQGEDYEQFRYLKLERCTNEDAVKVLGLSLGAVAQRRRKQQ